MDFQVNECMSLYVCVYNMYICVCVVARSCLTLCNPMDYTVHGIFQARILEWVAFHFSRGSSQLRNQTEDRGYITRLGFDQHPDLISAGKSCVIAHLEF